MTPNASEQVFSLALRFAIVVCLGTLVVGLAVGVSPLTAVLRSGVAFVAFVLLGWAASVLVGTPATEATSMSTEEIASVIDSLAESLSSQDDQGSDTSNGEQQAPDQEIPSTGE